MNRLPLRIIDGAIAYAHVAAYCYYMNNNLAELIPEDSQLDDWIPVDLAEKGKTIIAEVKAEESAKPKNVYTVFVRTY